jgi:hypothetical protein
MVWYSSLLMHLFIHPRHLPAVADDQPDTIWLHSVSDDLHDQIAPLSTYPAPSSKVTSAAREEFPDEAIAIAQTRPQEAPSLVWPTTRHSDSNLDRWYEDNAPGNVEDTR